MPDTKIGADCECRGSGTYLELPNFLNILEETHFIGGDSYRIGFPASYVCVNRISVTVCSEIAELGELGPASCKNCHCVPVR